MKRIVCALLLLSLCSQTALHAGQATQGADVSFVVEDVLVLSVIGADTPIQVGPDPVRFGANVQSIAAFRVGLRVVEAGDDLSGLLVEAGASGWPGTTAVELTTFQSPTIWLDGAFTGHNNADGYGETSLVTLRTEEGTFSVEPVIEVS